MKPTNPKDAIGSSKLPLHLWPETATALGCLGCLDGMLKYGRANWRVSGVRASIYYDAARRHINKWFEGENADQDSGLPHLAHALACLAIIVDAQAAGKLTDDRMVPGGYERLIDELTPHVARLKQIHADKNPEHFTFQNRGMTHLDDRPKLEAADGPTRDNVPAQRGAALAAPAASAPREDGQSIPRGDSRFLVQQSDVRPMGGVEVHRPPAQVEDDRAEAVGEAERLAQWATG
jgi:hypothetical protein